MTKGLEMGWRTNEFYIEYLELKTEIAELVQKASWAHVFLDNGKANREKLDEKMKRMQVVLWELKSGGITAEMLLYLSWGIDVINYEKESEGNEEHVESL